MCRDVLNRLLEGVKSTNPSWFAIIADEATDVSNKEQMNLSIRLVDNDYAISEDPVSLVDLDDTFSNTLVRAVKGVLTRANLQLNMCRGQAYDGAANMQYSQWRGNPNPSRDTFSYPRSLSSALPTTCSSRSKPEV